MPGSYLRVIDKHSPAEHLYIIHLKEEIPPHELLKSPLYSDLTSAMSLVISDVEIASKNTHFVFQCNLLTLIFEVRRSIQALFEKDLYEYLL
jgi:hypothetical protein